MLEIKIIMRCRYCGEKFTIDPETITGLPRRINRSKTEIIQLLKTSLIEDEKSYVHECVDGILGVADMVGIDLKES